MNEFEEDTTLRPADYATFPAALPGYRWSVPLLTGLLLAVLHTAFGVVLVIAVMLLTDPGKMLGNLIALSNGYDGFDLFDAPMAVINIGTVALLLPALMLSVKITRERPFSTFSSIKGGFRFRLYFKMLAVSLIAFIPMIADAVLTERTATHPTALVLLLVTALCPVQCIAEEYVFRGLVMQTVGSWTGRWIFGLIAQMGIFALLHPYNFLGIISICVLALAFGVSAWYTNGLEASSALHTVNNLLGFYAILFGFGELSSEVDAWSLVFSVITAALYIGLLVFIQKKYSWFDAVKERS